MVFCSLHVSECVCVCVCLRACLPSSDTHTLRQMMRERVAYGAQDKPQRSV